jgi:hypothetical protein
VRVQRLEVIRDVRDIKCKRVQRRRRALRDEQRAEQHENLEVA